MIVFIWAEDLAGNIGNKGKLPWHLPADLKHFKRLTENHIIVMGRKTFDSFPGLLKNRHHVILTTDAEFTNYYKDNDQITIFNSLTDLRKWLLNEQKTIYIIGGFSLFDALKDIPDRLEQTIIQNKFKADTKMAIIDYNRYKLINRKDFCKDTKNKYNYSFLTYVKL